MPWPKTAIGEPGRRYPLRRHARAVRRRPLVLGARERETAEADPLSRPAETIRRALAAMNRDEQRRSRAGRLACRLLSAGRMDD